MAAGEQPEITDTGTEKEILYQRVCEQVRQTLTYAVQQEITVAEGKSVIAAMAVTAVLARLRVMSGRQVAVLLAQEADRHAGYEIHEPPRYSASEIENVT